MEKYSLEYCVYPIWRVLVCSLLPRDLWLVMAATVIFTSLQCKLHNAEFTIWQHERYVTFVIIQWILSNSLNFIGDMHIRNIRLSSPLLDAVILSCHSICLRMMCEIIVTSSHLILPFYLSTDDVWDNSHLILSFFLSTGDVWDNSYTQSYILSYHSICLRMMCEIIVTYSHLILPFYLSTGDVWDNSYTQSYILSYHSICLRMMCEIIVTYSHLILPFYLSIIATYHHLCLSSCPQMGPSWH